MADLFTTKNKKIATTAGMIVTGYTAIAAAFPQLSAIPFINQPLIGGITPLVIAGALTLYGVIFYWKEF